MNFSKETQQKIDHNKSLLKSLMSVGMNKPASKTMSIEESIQKYNPSVSEEEIKAWVWYRKKQGIPMKNWGKYNVKVGQKMINSWIADDILFIDPESLELVPYPVYMFGNLYTKTTALKKNQNRIIEKYGQEVYDNHLKVLEDNKPEMLSIQNPDASKRPAILAISDFAKEFQISELKSSSGVVISDTMSLQFAFRDWLREYPREQIKENIEPYEIIRIYLDKARQQQGLDKEVKKKKKQLAKKYGEKLFAEFLHEALLQEDQFKIDIEWNSTYNATTSLMYHKIPIGLELSKQFGDAELQLKDVQREGVAFMELNGSGILGFDVGVGKTMTAIAEVASAIKNGKAKRPLIIVPNSTYENWMLEMKGKNGKPGILSNTGIEVNDLDNLGVNVNIEPEDIKDGTISLLSKSGLEKYMGFNVTDEMEELESILNQDDIVGKSKTKRQREQFKEKIEGIIGDVIAGTNYDFQDFGFDYLCVDEAHNYKKVFSTVKARDKQQKDFEITAGTPSKVGQKMFFLTNYIQRKYGRNVLLLTATPFTNSPLEIYSMLSFVAYDYMKKNGILNIRSFFEQFVFEQEEWVIKQSGKITRDNIVKRFNNIVALQKLINTHVNFKDARHVKNLVRPCKINIPRLSGTERPKGSIINDDGVNSIIKMSEMQKNNQAIINSIAKQPGDRKDPGKHLRLLNQSMNNALSPFLYDEESEPESYTDFVESSAKIKYAIECIATVKEWHEKNNTPMTGQIIYINRAKDYFPLIKEYLIKEVGFKTGLKMGRAKVDEVELFIGGMNNEKKEKITDAFNKGITKVVIGTSTMKEGVNLQENSTVLYNLFPDWNPTDVRQLEGRLHRQKNPFGYVRSVMPLVENSMDVFIFQKLEEKTSRINQLWESQNGENVLDEESLDPNAIKMALVTDLDVLVDFEIDLEKEELQGEGALLKANIENLEQFTDVKERYDRLRQQILQDCLQANIKGRALFNDSNFLPVRYTQAKEIKNKDLTKEQLASIRQAERLLKLQDEIDQNDYDDKKLIKFHRQFYEDAYIKRSQLNDFKEAVARYNKILKSVERQKGTTDVSRIGDMITESKQEFEELQKRFENLTSKEHKQKVFERIKEKKSKLEKTGQGVSERVKEFEQLNHLLQYRINDVHGDGTCDNPLNSETLTKQKQKRKKLAKAKAKALLILQQQEELFN